MNSRATIYLPTNHHRSSRSGIYKWNIYRAISLMCDVLWHNFQTRFATHVLNPYQTTNEPTHSPIANAKPSSRVRWAMIGFVLSAAIPVAFGSYGMYQDQIHLASLGPTEGACGMGALGSLVMIFMIGPFCGMIGAGSGWIAWGIDWWQLFEQPRNR